jgi:hypothetical protein
VPSPTQLLTQRVTALLTKSHGGAVRFVKDSGPFGGDGVYPAMREGNRSAAFVFGVLVFVAMVTVLVMEGMTLGYARSTDAKLFLLGCALLLGTCTWWLTDGGLAFMAVSFS